MPTYKYKAVNEMSGEPVTGKMEAESKAELFDKVRAEGSRVISTQEVTVFQGLNWDWLYQITATINVTEKIRFAHNLSSMLSAGLTTTRALSVLKRQTRNPRFKYTLEQIEKDISEGKTFHDALARFQSVFSPLFIAMVRAGEESGTLAKSLEIISKQMDEAYQLKRKIRGAMMYPAIVVMAMFGIGVLMLVFIVPTLQKTFEDIGAELPPATQFVINLSDFVQNYPILILGMTVSILGLLIYGFRTSVGRRMFEFCMLHFPVVAELTREINAARTTRTLSSLLSSGVTMLHAISITRDVIQNSYYKDILKDAEERVEKGENLSKVLQENVKFYPVFVGEMASVGEETGDISAMLEEVAKFYEDDVSSRTKNMSTIVEPLLMIFIGIGVGFFAYSMLMPIYSLVDQI